MIKHIDCVNNFETKYITSFKKLDQILHVIFVTQIDRKLTRPRRALC